MGQRNGGYALPVSPPPPRVKHPYLAIQRLCDTGHTCSHGAGIRNATQLPDQQNRRFVIADGLSWNSAEEKCKKLGVSICPAEKVCRKDDNDKLKKKDKLKTGGKGKKGRLQRQLCLGKKGFGGMMGMMFGKGKKGATKGKQGPDTLRDKTSVCNFKEEQDLLTRWLPVVDGNQHVWANIATCDIKTSMPGESEQGVVACCGSNQLGGGHQHVGLFAAVHPSVVIQKAEKKVQKQNAGSKKPTDDDWSKHEYIDKMRSSDPFLAHKQKGTKMKAMHDHVAEKASEHLGNATVAAVADGIKNLHNKIKSHVNNVVDALKSGSNSTAVGPISGDLSFPPPSLSLFASVSLN